MNTWDSCWCKSVRTATERPSMNKYDPLQPFHLTRYPRVTIHKLREGKPMRKTQLLMVFVFCVTLTSTAVAFFDDFEDGADAWTPDEELWRPDGVHWEGWIAEDGVLVLVLHACSQIPI